MVFFLQEDGTPERLFGNIWLDYDLPSWGKKIFPLQGMLEDDFPFSRGGISWFWRGDRKAISNNHQVFILDG